MAKNGNHKLGLSQFHCERFGLKTPPLKLRRKVLYISLLEEMVSSCSCGGASVN